MMLSESLSEQDISQYSKSIIEFLRTFKVKPCMKDARHDRRTCHSYHSQLDKRRNPYLTEGFIYYLEAECSDSDCCLLGCQKYHNAVEYYYHPFLYKTQSCAYGSKCNRGPYCNGIHATDYPYLHYAKLFRFDLKTFKAHLCNLPHTSPSEYGTCLFYHNSSDRRRNPSQVEYSHVKCPKQHCRSDHCPYSHNKIQQLYHPSRYKSKYCQSHYKGQHCLYGQLCSFAHDDDQVSIQLLHLMEKDDYFWKHKYKTHWCPYIEAQNCPYAHNFQDFRREPDVYNYSCQECPYWVKGEVKSLEEAGCPHQMNCTKSHGWLQSKYHPNNLNTTQQHPLAPNCPPTYHNPTERWGTGAPFVVKGNPEPSFPHPLPIRDHKCPNKKRKTVGGKRQRAQQPPRKAQKLFFQEWEMPSEDIWDPEKLKGQRMCQEAQFPMCEPFKNYKVFKAPAFTSPLYEVLPESMQMLEQHGLAKKLEQHEINQQKLMGLKEEEVSQIGWLTGQERHHLTVIVEEYLKEHAMHDVKYSDSMISLLKRNQMGSVVNKMVRRTVAQGGLLYYSRSRINRMSFLNVRQKSRLPRVISKYLDARMYQELSVEFGRPWERDLT